MNSATITINGVDYTRKAIFPLKWANLLDERLDELYVTLKNVKKSVPFTPMTDLILTLENSPSAKVFGLKKDVKGVVQNLNDDKSITQSVIKRFIIAQDTTIENPAKPELSDHQIYAIEETKLLEGIICDSLQFQNSITNSFVKSVMASGSYSRVSNASTTNGIWQSKILSGVFDPYVSNKIPTPEEIYRAETGLCIPVPLGDNSIISNVEFVSNNSTVAVFDSAHNSINITNNTVVFNEGSFTIEYKIIYQWNEEVTGSFLGVRQAYVNIIYTVAAFKEVLPLKKYTITDCVVRCLELAEPLKVIESTGETVSGDLEILKKETPRFVFDGIVYSDNGLTYSITPGSQAEKYDKIIAPTFTMTKSTLREQLQQIGGFIHGEPRLENGVIYFDEYGANNYSDISKKRRISAQSKQSIDDYCTALDSNADNLINRIDYADGAIIEPFTGGYKTLRSEQTTLIITDTESSFISTQRPIMDIIKLEAQALLAGSTSEYTPWVDLTPNVYEAADYNNLSSYDGFYPYAKAYALYYTQGEKNIRGLFFKNEDVISSVFQNYAIVNIFALNGQKINEGGNDFNAYAQMRFRVKYVPRFNARVKTNKSVVVDSKPRSIVYNQSANIIESRYYGENLKGVVARLGNVEKQYTYKVAYLTDIPKAGELYDNNYYISAVSTEYYPSYIKVTIGLSKDFNRLSEYIGISSDIRMWEVSEKQAANRDSIYTEYVCFKYGSTEASDKDTLINKTSTKRGLVGAISGITANQVTEAVVYGLLKTGAPVKSYGISLPVVSTAFGNSLLFSFNFEDNYSAGQKVMLSNAKALTNYVPYTDFYGRFYYLNFALKAPLSSEQNADPFALPQRDGASLANDIFSTRNSDGYETPYVYRKNGGEIVAVNYQVSYVTDDENTVIGSGIASKCPLVTGASVEKPQLYILPKRLPLFESKVDVTGLSGYTIPAVAIEAGTGNLVFNTNVDTGTPVVAQTDGKAWVIVTPKQEVSEDVVDEDGNKTTQTINYGNEIILGRNVDISAGDNIELPFVCFKRKIYK